MDIGSGQQLLALKISVYKRAEYGEHKVQLAKISFFRSRNQQLGLIGQYLDDLKLETVRSQSPDQIVLASALTTTMWSSYTSH
ncbi:MAG: hypothetical protein AAF572_07920 [Cyanobacteria bacterium P01_B01_bin.77]